MVEQQQNAEKVWEGSPDVPERTPFVLILKFGFYADSRVCFHAWLGPAVRSQVVANLISRWIEKIDDLPETKDLTREIRRAWIGSN